MAVAGLNPHAGEGGLLGTEDSAEIRPAVEQARARGIDAHGPESADSLFARARRGEFDWSCPLYHDQGLIAVKTSAFGTATNWTLACRSSAPRSITAPPSRSQARGKRTPSRSALRSTRP